MDAIGPILSIDGLQDAIAAITYLSVHKSQEKHPESQNLWKEIHATNEELENSWRKISPAIDIFSGFDRVHTGRVREFL